MSMGCFININKSDIITLKGCGRIPLELRASTLNPRASSVARTSKDQACNRLCELSKLLPCIQQYFSVTVIQAATILGRNICFYYHPHLRQITA